jgi:hypothetical protein
LSARATSVRGDVASLCPKLASSRARPTRAPACDASLSGRWACRSRRRSRRSAKLAKAACQRSEVALGRRDVQPKLGMLVGTGRAGAGSSVGENFTRLHVKISDDWADLLSVRSRTPSQRGARSRGCELWYIRDVTGEDERRVRAERRRRGYPGEVIAAGTPKPPLYAELSLLERLAHMTALSRRQAALSGAAQPPLPRSAWPGEVFRLGES